MRISRRTFRGGSFGRRSRKLLHRGTEFVRTFRRRVQGDGPRLSEGQLGGSEQGRKIEWARCSSGGFWERRWRRDNYDELDGRAAGWPDSRASGGRALKCFGRGRMFIVSRCGGQRVS